MMKKELQRTIIMGLLCASVIPGVGYGAAITQSTNFDTTEIMGGADESPLSIQGNGTSDDIVIDFAIKQGMTNLIALGNAGISNTTVGQSVVIKGNDLDIDVVNLANSDERHIENITGGNLTIDSFVNMTSGLVDGSNAVDFVYNDGTLKFNNLAMIGGSISSESLANTVGIHNDKNGIMNINSSLVIYMSEMNLDGTVNEANGIAIKNDGKLIIDNTLPINTTTTQTTLDESVIIQGDIYHNGITSINLKNENSMFMGKIIGSNSDFQLKLTDGAYWWVQPGQEGHAITGLELNNGAVYLPSLRDGEYSKLSLINFKSDGNFNAPNDVGGIRGFVISTDIANDEGDCIEFLGTTPNATVPVYIIDKLVYEENAAVITPEDGHSVTIAETPVNSDMKINGISTYGVGNILYSAVIEEVNNDNVNKHWNFLGWSEGGSKDVGGEIKQQENDPNINIIDIDNTLKRLNDIRTDPSEVGVWIRGERGKTKISSYGYEYSLTSGGYDWIHENDNANIFAGVGISYSQNDCDTGIIGDTKSLGFNLYGSWYGKKNHDYVDVIVKYGRLDKDYAGYDANGVFVSGDYDKDLFSIAAKYGRRFTQKNGWYYEPFAGLTWGRVGSADFVDSQNVRIHADSTTSKIAMLGMQVGTNVKGMEYYGKVEVRHDFDGKMHVSAPESTLPGAHAYEDMGGTWCKLAVGASRKINSNNSFYLDLEKDFGNKVKKPYGVSFGYRYTW